MQRPLTLSLDDIHVIESFVVSLYSMTCSLMEVNQACQQIFAQSSRTFEYLPPTKAALIEHIKRVTYQAGGNLLWLNKFCQAQVPGGGMNLSLVGCLSGLPSIQQQKRLKSWLVVGAQKNVQASAHVIRKALCAQPGANVEETVMGSQVLQVQSKTYTANKLHNIIVCGYGTFFSSKCKKLGQKIMISTYIL